MKIAVVGARDASNYGTTLAYSIGRMVAERGHVVVTGGSYGVDYYVAVGALDAGGKVVLWLPWLNPPPFKHIDILLSRGAVAKSVVKERPVSDKAVATLFALRSRRIAEESDIIIVPEARYRQHGWGTIITVETALEMRKPVYVIYGETRDMATDRAIRIMASKGAVVVDYDKLLEIFSDTEQSEKLKERSKV